MNAKKKSAKAKVRAIDSAAALGKFVKSICDILRRSNCQGALQYVPELTWILFLRLLDAYEARDKQSADAVGATFASALRAPYRWRDWAAPYSEDADHPKTPEGKPFGWKRQELFAEGEGKLIEFINTQLLPYLHALDVDPKTKLPNPSASGKQRVIGRIMTAVERVRVDSESNLRDVLDKVDHISIEQIDDTHFFTLSQVYEGLLLKMGEKNSDGGAFFTPREVIRAMVRTLSPQLGETVYDPCCGTGGFLAIAYEHVLREFGDSLSSTDLEAVKTKTFFGREKDNLAFPIALANLVLHGIDQPNIWHGNALTKRATYTGLFETAPKQFDVILTNPPFGGKEGKDAQKNYAYATGSTQVLFVQDILEELADEGRCAIVLDDGFLFRTDESAFVETKRKLVDECDLWAIVRLPLGVFVSAGATVNTNLLFFKKGSSTRRIWYYDLTHVRVGKKNPLTLAHFGWKSDGTVLDDDALPATLTEDWDDASGAFPSFAKLLPSHGEDGESQYSWSIDFAARKATARQQIEPLLAEVGRCREAAVAVKERLKAVRGGATGFDQESLEAELRELERKAKDAQVEVDALDAAVYDLRSVNPNAVVVVDHRSPSEVLGSLREQTDHIREELEKLRSALPSSLRTLLAA